MRYDQLWLAASLVGVLVTAGPAAHAAVAFSENFDTGSATFTTDNAYWSDHGETNDYIVQNSGSVPGFSNTITHDASGTGFFLFEGTTNPVPSGSTEFYIGPTFSVAANTTYTVSFELTNQNNSNIAQVQPELDGTLLGSPVSAAGSSPAQSWQAFSFTWNSGANTSASLILHNFQAAGFGNDYGIDNLSVTSAAVPEPATLLVLTTGIAGLLTSRRRRGK
jgi:PEP-CTERM motif